MVILRWNDDMPAEAIERLSAALDDLSRRSTELIDYVHGSNIGIDQRNWDYGVVATFEGVEAFERFRDDPGHLELIERLIKPWLAERAALQLDG